MDKKKANKEFQKWGNKEKYDKEYLRLFGVKCCICNGTGWRREYDPELGALQGVQIHCQYCNGIGYIEKKKGVKNESI